MNTKLSEPIAANTPPNGVDHAAPAQIGPQRPAPRAFRPSSKRRIRIIVGLVIAALAVVANVLVYTSLNKRVEVLQLVRPIEAGARLQSTDVRAVEVDLDPSVPAIPADQVGTVVGQFAVTFLTPGTLLTPNSFQPKPLVDPNTSQVAFSVDLASMPDRVVNRSLVNLIIIEKGAGGIDVAASIPARVVSIRTGSDSGGTSLTVEVNPNDAARVATANDIKVVLVQPASDPATEGGG